MLWATTSEGHLLIDSMVPELNGTKARADLGSAQTVLISDLESMTLAWGREYLRVLHLLEMFMAHTMTWLQ